MIVLTGFMGAGKSTVGHLLAARLGLPFRDSDRIIEVRTGRSIHEIFRRDGEPAFRELEREVVADVLNGPDAVVALGGGAVGDPVTAASLEWKTVVYLHVSFGEALRRIQGDGGRPLLARSGLDRLYAQRDPAYRRVADHVVNTDARLPEQVVDDIERLLRPEVVRDLSVRRVPVAAASRGYEVVIGTGLARKMSAFFPYVPEAERVIVVTHPSLTHVAQPVVDSLGSGGLTADVALVPEGERSKTLTAAAALYEKLAAFGAHRNDLLVAVGGGVITDLAGFVASTYHRGMPLLNVPTTLLGQVDAAIGGKNAVNLPHGKNLVGTFHQPVGVICDVDLLGSLPEREIRSGLAEVIKYGLIRDPTLLHIVNARRIQLLAGEAEAMEEVVARSVAVKAAVVASDERESSVRAHLNYGHTFAHAIEHAAGFEGVRHGEAVALGMMAAAHLAHVLGRVDDEVVDIHRTALRAVGLPTTAQLDIDVLEKAWRHDKKYRHGVRFVLLRGLAHPQAGVAASREDLVEALRRLAR